MAEVNDTRQQAATGRSKSIAAVTNLIGAGVSLALVIGIGIWGYKILVRDVSGVPVVRAADGPMRIQPENPGGEQARHQGLSVNSVAAIGVAQEPADRLILAPEPLDLTLDDIPATSPNAEDGDRSAGQNELHLAALRSTDAADAPETSRQTDTETNTERTMEGMDDTEENMEGADSGNSNQEDGLERSLRPVQRPAKLAAIQQTLAATEPESPAEIDPETIEAGTRLAQLGAFETAEIARKEWARLSGRFSDYLDGKDRVVQEATSGGRTFYRLRAMGFADLSDTRRFCSALVAENAECIPVVVR